MDGDLGRYDSLGTRLAATDAVAGTGLLPGPVRMARPVTISRACRFLVVDGAWLRRSRPAVMGAIAEHAASADLHVLRTPRALGHSSPGWTVQAAAGRRPCRLS